MEEVLDADVFVELGPMNSAPLADKPPIASFRGRSVKQPRIPGQRNGNRPAVGKLDDQIIVAEAYASGGDHAFFGARKTHTVGPQDFPGGSTRSVSQLTKF